MQRNFLWNFYGPEDTQWDEEAPGGALRGAQPTRARLDLLAHPSGLSPPRDSPQVQPGPNFFLLSHKKSS